MQERQKEGKKEEKKYANPNRLIKSKKCIFMSKLMNESCIKEDPIYIVSRNFPLNCIFSLHVMQFIKAHGLKNAF